jgi:hypothetical protein
MTDKIPNTSEETDGRRHSKRLPEQAMREFNGKNDSGAQVASKSSPRDRDFATEWVRERKDDATEIKDGKKQKKKVRFENSDRIRT